MLLSNSMRNMFCLFMMIPMKNNVSVLFLKMRDSARGSIEASEGETVSVSLGDRPQAEARLMRSC